MDQVHFFKFEASGNDFILLKDFENELNLSPHYVRNLCHRQRGIGADGVLHITRSFSSDAKMNIYNADGLQAEMCGNGLRCVSGFLKSFFLPTQRKFLIESNVGIHSCVVFEGEAEVSLGKPINISLDERFSTKFGAYDVHLINTGVPHGVVFCEDVEEDDFLEICSTLRSHEKVVPLGMNVNFVQIIDQDKPLLKVRTFERGVEGETLSCGTGVVASAVVSFLKFGLDPEVMIETRSKDRLKCRIEYSEQMVKEVFLRGPFRYVYSGEVFL